MKSIKKKKKMKCKHDYRLAYTQSIPMHLIPDESGKVGMSLIFYCTKCLEITRRLD